MITNNVSDCARLPTNVTAFQCFSSVWVASGYFEHSIVTGIKHLASYPNLIIYTIRFICLHINSWPIGKRKLYTAAGQQLL